jgi:hypothetical protein
MNEPTAQGNGDAGQTLAPVSLLAALQGAYDKVEPVESHQHWGIAGRPAYRDGYRDGQRSGLYRAIEILKASSAANDQAQRRPDNATPSATKGNEYE